DLAAANLPGNTLSVLLNTGGQEWLGVPGSATAGARASLRVWPNPAVGALHIQFSLPAAADVAVRVHDLAGRVVREISIGERVAGGHTVGWDGHLRDGTAAPAGIYFVELRVGRERVTRRAVLLE